MPHPPPPESPHRLSLVRRIRSLVHLLRTEGVGATAFEILLRFWPRARIWSWLARDVSSRDSGWTPSDCGGVHGPGRLPVDAERSFPPGGARRAAPCNGQPASAIGEYAPRGDRALIETDRGLFLDPAHRARRIQGRQPLQGRVAAPVDLATGRVSGEAHNRHEGLLASHHPDTGVCFEGFQVPMMEEAVALVVRMHRFLYGLASSSPTPPSPSLRCAGSGGRPTPPETRPASGPGPVFHRG
jgi:hypothetical protein